MDHYASDRLIWAVALQVTFVLTALGLGAIERLTRH